MTARRALRNQLGTALYAANKGADSSMDVMPQFVPQTLLFKGGHKKKAVKILANVTGVLKPVSPARSGPCQSLARLIDCVVNVLHASLRTLCSLRTK
jgi:hypothetical protein